MNAENLAATLLAYLRRDVVVGAETIAGLLDLQLTELAGPAPRMRLPGRILSGLIDRYLRGDLDLGNHLDARGRLLVDSRPVRLAAAYRDGLITLPDSVGGRLIRVMSGLKPRDRELSRASDPHLRIGDLPGTVAGASGSTPAPVSVWRAVPARANPPEPVMRAHWELGPTGWFRPVRPSTSSAGAASQTEYVDRAEAIVGRPTEPYALPWDEVVRVLSRYAAGHGRTGSLPDGPDWTLDSRSEKDPPDKLTTDSLAYALHAGRLRALIGSAPAPSTPNNEIDYRLVHEPTVQPGYRRRW